MTKDFWELLQRLAEVRTNVARMTQQAIDEVWPPKIREQLATAMMEFADQLQAYQERADKMTEDEAGSFLTGRVRQITKADYEENFEDWTEGPEPNRQGFKVYVTQVITHSIEAAIICEKHKALRDKLKGIIEDYVAEVYPEAEELKPLPKMPKKPKKYSTPTNLLIHDLTTKPMINAGPLDLPVMPDKDITTYVAIAYDADKEKAPFNLTSKQRTVMEAAYALYKQAEAEGIPAPVVTPVSIYKAMPGGGMKPTPAKVREISETCSMLRDMPIELDASSEMIASGKIARGEKFHVKTNVLLARQGRYVRKNGTISIGWQLFEAPVICAYAEKMGQLVSVPVKVVQIEGINPKTGEPDGLLLSINDNRREALAYLVRRVGVMQNAYRKAKNAERLKRNKEAGKTWRELMTQSPKILYESVFEALALDTTNRHTLKDIRDFCIAVLRYWKAIGYIVGFDEVKAGKQRQGVKIMFE